MIVSSSYHPIVVLYQYASPFLAYIISYYVHIFFFFFFMCFEKPEIENRITSRKLGNESRIYKKGNLYNDESYGNGKINVEEGSGGADCEEGGEKCLRGWNQSF